MIYKTFIHNTVQSYKAPKLIKDIIHCTWSAFERATIKDSSATLHELSPLPTGLRKFPKTRRKDAQRRIQSNRKTFSTFSFMVSPFLSHCPQTYTINEMKQNRGNIYQAFMVFQILLSSQNPMIQTFFPNFAIMEPHSVILPKLPIPIQSISSQN